MEVAATFASQCDVITLEFENIPSQTIALCSKHAPTYPKASVLATAQNRLLEKSTLQNADLPVTPFAEVKDADAILSAAETMGWPLIIKTAQSGYDGKGQYRIESPAQIESIPLESGRGWIAEKCIHFEREVSVIVARAAGGQVRCFPVFENSHHRHILDVTVTPASISDSLSDRARQIAIGATEILDVVGLLCVEFFVHDGDVMINEVAPRPHNSGHLSIEACPTSQFQQHVRAICNLPLGETELRCGAAAMANLLGDTWTTDGQAPDWARALHVEGVNLHLYGKQSAKPGRKMGHLTVTGSTPEEVEQRVREARRRLQ
ncbi:MAG: 5-(carboxyamino)imidazole ribonucleotide synthase, partial [Pirellulales bacterium]|nr:5-(carboxyamino)imidazole ribonucleotide synthase [Pirellulales bacterium]